MKHLNKYTWSHLQEYNKYQCDYVFGALPADSPFSRNWSMKPQFLSLPHQIPRHPEFRPSGIVCGGILCARSTTLEGNTKGIQPANADFCFFVDDYVDVHGLSSILPHKTRFKVGTWARPESRVVGYQLMCWVQGTRWTETRNIGGSQVIHMSWERGSPSLMWRNVILSIWMDVFNV